MSVHKPSSGSRTDLSALKDIPGYKAILKTVLKSQIQLLIEQLAENTGEESIILTASLNDGSLSHLGSNMGKTFLDGREEIKSQFLGFCLKGHHQMVQEEDRGQAFGRSDGIHMPQMSSRRPRIRPHPYAMSPSHSHTSPSHSRPNTTQDLNSSHSSYIKPEDGSSNSADNFIDSVSSNNLHENHQVGFPQSVNLSHTQTSSQSDENDLNQSGLSGAEDQSFSTKGIKIEPGSDDPEEEDVAIIEPGENSASSEKWAQRDPNETNQPGFKLTNGSQIDSSTSDHYKTHVISRNNITHKIYACNYCGKQSFRKGDIDRHVVKHTKEKRFACPECDQAYTRKHGLLIHLSRMHPNCMKEMNPNASAELSAVNSQWLNAFPNAEDISTSSAANDF